MLKYFQDNYDSVSTRTSSPSMFLVLSLYRHPVNLLYL